MFEKIKTNNVVKNSPGDLPATTAILSNNQIGKYIDRKNATVLKNVFSATANGFGKSFYQPYDFTVLQDSYAFKFKDDLIRINKIHPFINSCLNKIYSKYDWGNKSGWTKIKQEYIKLPTKDGKIDFEFIESFIAELEAQHIAQLEAYLKATGLNNYELTSDEKKSIDNFNGIKWVEYRIGDLFEKIKTNNVVKNSPGDLPATTAILSNNQIGKYINRKNATVLKNVFSATANGFGKSFYQPYDFTVLQDSYAFKFKDDLIRINKIHPFINSCLNKIYSKYDWGNKSGWTKIKQEYIKLPTKDGKIDFEYIELFITAVQKSVIKDVVIYANNKISATKNVCKSK